VRKKVTIKEYAKSQNTRLWATSLLRDVGAASLSHGGITRVNRELTPRIHSRSEWVTFEQEGVTRQADAAGAAARGHERRITAVFEEMDGTVLPGLAGGGIHRAFDEPATDIGQHVKPQSLIVHQLRVRIVGGAATTPRLDAVVVHARHSRLDPRGVPSAFVPFLEFKLCRGSIGVAPAQLRASDMDPAVAPRGWRAGETVDDVEIPVPRGFNVVDERAGKHVPIKALELARGLRDTGDGEPA